MKRFKYQISYKGTQKETWVCEACKKANNEFILKGKWKLIDRCKDATTPCEICEDDKAINK